MNDTSGRMLRLLSLLQTHRDWAGTELAQRLGVTSRTVRRDVDRLRALGYPIHAVPGVAGYTLGAGSQMPPLLLDDEEAVAVTVSLGTASSVAGIGEAAARALAKLEQVLPPRLRFRVETLQEAMVAMPDQGPAVAPQTLSDIAAAIRRRERLRFDYADHRGATSAREVEAYRLVHGGRRWYLVAWDPGVGDWRTFRADRVIPKVPGGPRFTPRPLPPDLGQRVSFGVSTAAYPHQGRFRIHAPAEAVAERIGPTAATVEPVDEVSCLLHCGAASLDDLGLYVARLGFDFEVEEPPRLRERVRALAARLARAVSADETTANPDDDQHPSEQR